MSDTPAAPEDPLARAERLKLMALAEASAARAELRGMSAKVAALEQQRLTVQSTPAGTVDSESTALARRASDLALTKAALDHQAATLREERAALKVEQEGYRLQLKFSEARQADTRERLRQSELEVAILRGRVRLLEAAADGPRREQQELELQIKALRQELASAKSRERALARDVEGATALAHEATRKSSTLDAVAKRQKTRASNLAAELKLANQALDRRVQLSVRSGELLEGMLLRRAPEFVDPHAKQVVTCGSGPWPVEALDAALVAVGLEPQYLDHEANTFGLFVVGREGVDVDTLRDHLDERFARSQPFGLYSQELFVLCLLCGDDLLADTSLHDLLISEFAEDHPVLSQFLEADEWTWPVCGNESDIDLAADHLGTSPLSEFGYRVGKNSDAPKVRRQCLREFWQLPDLKPYFKAEHDAVYRKRWGRPGSKQRLIRMVQHLRWLRATQGKDQRKEQAADDWDSDLAWIRKTLVPEMPGTFIWPA